MVYAQPKICPGKPNLDQTTRSSDNQQRNSGLCCSSSKTERKQKEK